MFPHADKTKTFTNNIIKKKKKKKKNLSFNN